MTVKELIEKLKTLDQDSEIKVYAEYEYGGGWDYANIERIEKVKKKDFDGDNKYIIYHDYSGTRLNF